MSEAAMKNYEIFYRDNASHKCISFIKKLPPNSNLITVTIADTEGEIEFDISLGTLKIIINGLREIVE